jgi:hypothetical protein
MLLLISFAMNAQHHRTCSTHEKYLQTLATDPALASRRTAMEEQIQSWISNNANHRYQQTLDVFVTVPVVVHVLYQNANQNISDAQILSQIDVLNTDYAHLNADSVITPSVFQPLMANTGIQFCMATQDPSGNPTSGIERRSVTVSQIGNTNQYYNYAQGGLSSWDHTKYLNFWLCDIDGGGTLGFSYLPGTTGAADDGVVIDPQYWGTLGTVSAPFNGGRTATHEVGHWFNLEHIWGDEPACAVDDQVSDTPLQKEDNYGCPSYPQTSQSGGRCNTSDSSSMYMNYMDYTDDACMVLFSLGQRDRMQAAVSTSRSGLFTSFGCQSPVGIASRNSSSWLTVSSNPTSGIVEVSTQNAPGNTSIIVSDMTGRFVYSEVFKDQNKYSVDLTNYTTGIYLMQVTNCFGNAVKKIVKE